MKTIITAIITITFLASCNGLGRDSDDLGTGAGNDTMKFQTHGIDAHQNTRVGNEIGTDPDSTVKQPENLVDSASIK